ncbi:hypothetical protein [Novosphingobium huizhouense]|uniref:hypothetical protein n=1 Tax=Novosphingobium huizhouense TaxID=2866625 RepID=UPI001CD82038|nr:hypothetical protein [Novosphingobium huizhouense]
MKTLLPLLATLPLAACATIPADVRADGFARLNEATRAGPVTVRPLAVIEDSRCPMNARCIQAGRVVVSAVVTEDGRPQERKLVLGEESLLASGSIMLDTVEPATRTDTPIRAQDYRFHFGWTDR